MCIVEPVLSGMYSVKIKHPPSIKRSFVKVLKITLITAILTSCIRWSFLLSSGHSLPSPNELFLLSRPVLNSYFVKGNHSNMVKSVQGN